MSWDPNRPRDGDQINEITDIMVSNRSGLDDGLQRYFHWSNQTANAGSLKTSVFSGTARFHYGPRSTVSFPGQEGSGHVISDESRVGIYLGTDLIVIGSKRAAHGLNEGVVDVTSIQKLGTPLNTVQLVQQGVTGTDASGNVTVTFPQAYDGIPQLVLESAASVERSEGSYVVTDNNSLTPSDVDLSAIYTGPGTDEDEALIYWRSVGTVTL